MNHLIIWLIFMKKQGITLFNGVLRNYYQDRALLKEDSVRYRWIQPHTTFDYLYPKDDHLYDLSFKVVRFAISDLSYETVFIYWGSSEVSLLDLIAKHLSLIRQGRKPPHFQNPPPSIWLALRIS